MNLQQKVSIFIAITENIASASFNVQGGRYLFYFHVKPHHHFTLGEIDVKSTSAIHKRIRYILNYVGIYSR